MPAADDEVLTHPDTEADTPPSRGARHRAAPTGASPGQRRALVGATTLGAAAALGAVLLPDRASGSGTGWLSAGGSGGTEGALAATTPKRTPTATTSKGTATTPGKKKPARAVAKQPAAGKPAADRDSSYTAAAKQGKARSGKVQTRAGLAARSLDPAKLLVPAGTMSSQLTSRGMTNTKADHEHLLGRATFGARPSDRAAIAKLGVDAWLAQQLDPMKLGDPGGDAVRGAFPLAGKDIAGVRGSVEEFSWNAAFETGQMTLGLQVHSSRQLYEIVVDVLANQLQVTIPSDNVWDNASDYNRTVIRKHAFGTFEDMLLAAMRHPAMLRYLNNDESDRESVNENLGRELLELHTVGVLSGYTETDVRNSAYILSGRTFKWETGQFVYEEGRHWNKGAVKVLGFSNANTGDGLAMGDAYLKYLARHKDTAQTIARKIATRFVSDNPPASLVDRLAKTYLDNGTAILPMLKTLFTSTEFWAAPQAKTRRPLEDVVGTARAVDVTVDGNLRKGVENLYWTLQNAGHAPLAWIPPNGYPDVVGAWQSANGMVRRWNVHRALTGGWIDGMKPAKEMIVDLRPAPGTTYGVWIDMISHRVIGRALDAPREAAVLAFLEAKSSDVVPEWMTTAKGDNKAWLAPQIASLVLDGPHHQLR
ncbi:MAG: DUF1800 family protein [Dermatophilaceae bacterium]